MTHYDDDSSCLAGDALIAAKQQAMIEASVSGSYYGDSGARIMELIGVSSCWEGNLGY